MAKGLSAAEMQAVAAYLSPAPAAGATAARERPRGPTAGTDRMCTANPPITPGPSDWASLGRDAASTRYQPNPGFTRAEIPRLKVKWSFAMSGGGAPSVVGRWLFTTNSSGRFYALDADSGCVRWMTPDVVSRTTPLVMRSSISPSGWAALVGVANRTVRAFDAQTGKELWRSPTLEDHPASGIKGSLAVSGDRVFVPLTSGEEGAAIQKTYACCTFRGSLVALDLQTGHLLWKTYVIPETPHPTRVNEAGVQMQGPAGGAIWSAPTVDERRGLVYVATGDSYTEAETDRDDAILAIDMQSG
jgi:polyvinyl alcohol dehydrogenase (cytochrome)